MDRPFYMEHYPNFLPKKYLSRNHYGRTHLKINVKSAHQHNDRRDGFHEVGDGCLVGTYFLGGLGEAGRSLAACHDVERGLLETDECA